MPSLNVWRNVSYSPIFHPPHGNDVGRRNVRQVYCLRLLSEPLPRSARYDACLFSRCWCDDVGCKL